jgi:type III secretion protein S
MNGFIDFLSLFKNALWLSTLISLPTVGLITLIGVFVAFFQAILQLQDQTLSFLLKLIAVSLGLLITAHWMGREMLSFTESAFNQIPFLFKR